MKSVKTFMESMRTETMGFSFGKPWRYGEDSITCVLPIIRRSEKKRKYVLMAEADKFDILDTGNINEVLMENKTDFPVFIRLGEILKGATQERATVSSEIVLPHQKKNVPVQCVHLSKGIVTGTAFQADGTFIPQRDESYLTSRHGGEVAGGHAQSMSWSMDTKYTAEVNVAFASAGIQGKRFSNDDLVSSYTEYKEKIGDDIIKNVPMVDNQIGFTLLDSRGFYNLECFDLHVSWKKLVEAIAGKEALKISEKDEGGVFEYKPKKAKEIVKNVLGSGYDEKVQYEDERSKVVTFGMEKYIGEAVELDGEVVHLLITRK